MVTILLSGLSSLVFGWVGCEALSYLTEHDPDQWAFWQWVIWVVVGWGIIQGVLIGLGFFLVFSMFEAPPSSLLVWVPITQALTATIGSLVSMLPLFAVGSFVMMVRQTVFGVRTYERRAFMWAGAILAIAVLSVAGIGLYEFSKTKPDTINRFAHRETDNIEAVRTWHRHDKRHRRRVADDEQYVHRAADRGHCRRAGQLAGLFQRYLATAIEKSRVSSLSSSRRAIDDTVIQPISDCFVGVEDSRVEPFVSGFESEYNQSILAFIREHDPRSGLLAIGRFINKQDDTSLNPSDFQQLYDELGLSGEQARMLARFDHGERESQIRAIVQIYQTRPSPLYQNLLKTLKESAEPDLLIDTIKTLARESVQATDFLQDTAARLTRQLSKPDLEQLAEWAASRNEYTLSGALWGLSDKKNKGSVIEYDPDLAREKAYARAVDTAYQHGGLDGAERFVEGWLAIRGGKKPLTSLKTTEELRAVTQQFTDQPGADLLGKAGAPKALLIQAGLMTHYESPMKTIRRLLEAYDTNHDYRRLGERLGMVVAEVYRAGDDQAGRNALKLLDRRLPPHRINPVRLTVQKRTLKNLTDHHQLRAFRDFADVFDYSKKHNGWLFVWGIRILLKTGSDRTWEKLAEDPIPISASVRSEFNAKICVGRIAYDAHEHDQPKKQLKKFKAAYPDLCAGEHLCLSEPSKNTPYPKKPDDPCPVGYYEHPAPMKIN